MRGEKTVRGKKTKFGEMKSERDSKKKLHE
jgi:hypothetical protein